MKKNSLDIIISGTGGQGTLTSGKIVSAVLVKAGYDVKMSAGLGIAQRGGSVVCHIRAGEKVYSPLISKGKADFLMLFDLNGREVFERYLKEKGLMILLEPSERIRGTFNRRCERVFYDEIIKELGNYRVVNMFMLGILSRYLDCGKKYWMESLKESKFSSRTKNFNLKAFKLGRGK